MEHIIPNSIYDSNFFVIYEICKKCNNKIGKEIEQPIIPYLKQLMAIYSIRGNFEISFGRRSKSDLKGSSGYLIEQGKVFPANFGIDLENHGWQVVIQDKNAMEFDYFDKNILQKKTIEWENILIKMDPNNSTINMESILFISPKIDDDPSVKLLFLFEKIIYEICYWFWGKIFVESKCAKNLCKSLITLKVDLDKWDNHDKSVQFFKIKDNIQDKQEQKGIIGKFTGDLKEIDESKSMFDNSPKITFAILSIKKVYLALINYCDEEFIYSLWDLPRTIKNAIKMNGDGFVILIDTTNKNGIKTYNISNYLKEKYTK